MMKRIFLLAHDAVYDKIAMNTITIHISYNIKEIFNACS